MTDDKLRINMMLAYNPKFLNDKLLCPVRQATQKDPKLLKLSSKKIQTTSKTKQQELKNIEGRSSDTAGVSYSDVKLHTHTQDNSGDARFTVPLKNNIVDETNVPLEVTYDANITEQTGTILRTTSVTVAIEFTPEPPLVQVLPPPARSHTFNLMKNNHESDGKIDKFLRFQYICRPHIDESIAIDKYWRKASTSKQNLIPLNPKLVTNKNSPTIVSNENDGNIVGKKSTQTHRKHCTCQKCRKLKYIQSKDMVNIAEKKLLYKLIGSSSILIRTILESHNIERTSNKNNINGIHSSEISNNSNECLLIWTSKHLRSNQFQSVKKHQKINSFPKSWELTRKDALCRNINRMIQIHGRRQFWFMPECYIYPEEINLVHTLFNSSSNNTGQAYASIGTSTTEIINLPVIVKPAGSSQGKGIYITDNIAQLPIPDRTSEEVWVVERYIHRPMLLNGVKFDLRLYVAVTSFLPLKIYIHREGLVRLASEPYCSSGYSDRFAHLTNYSVNKLNPKQINANSVPNNSNTVTLNENSSDQNNISTANESFSPRRPHSDSDSQYDENEVEDGNDEDDEGRTAESEKGRIKLTLEELWTRLSDLHVDIDIVKRKIHELIIKTIIAAEEKIILAQRLSMHNPDCCFELFGFDVLLDEDAQPWLMEVNFAPSLNIDSPLDLSVKTHMLTDLFNLVGIRTSNRGTDRKTSLQKQDVVGSAAVTVPVTSPSIDGDKSTNSCGTIVETDHQSTIATTEEDKAVEQRGVLVEPIPAVSIPSSSSVLPPTTPPSYSAQLTQLMDKSDSLRGLSEAERALLFDFCGEVDRSGGFELLFPTPDFQMYRKLFEEDREVNVLLAKLTSLFSGRRDKQPLTQVYRSNRPPTTASRNNSNASGNTSTQQSGRSTAAGSGRNAVIKRLTGDATGSVRTAKTSPLISRSNL